MRARVEVGDHARTHDVLPCERASVIRLEDPKIGELPDALAAGARAFGELILRQAVGVHPDPAEAAYKGSATKASWHAPEQK